MTRSHQVAAGSGCLGTVEVRIKFAAELRRFSLERPKPGNLSFMDYCNKIPNVDVLAGYADIHGDLLPINNDDNYPKAVSTANPLLRIFIQKKEEADSSAFGTAILIKKKKYLDLSQEAWLKAQDY
uniref:PB1 domain-containing protein n=1 Tax=Ursus americanus TaxID=9643 RepID=A0A452SI57_URSAM